ncbi:hypothetical protein RUND412_002744 [Rhizina undulata]
MIGQRRRGEDLWNGKGRINLAQLRVGEAIVEEALRSLRNWKIEPRPSQPRDEKSPPEVTGGASKGGSSLPAMSSNWAPFSWGFSTSPPDKIPATVSVSAPSTIRPFSLFPSISASLAAFPISLSIPAARNSTSVTCNVQPEVYATTDKSHRWFSNNKPGWRARILPEDVVRLREQRNVLLTVGGVGLMFFIRMQKLRNKRARKRPHLNALDLEVEDGSDTEDIIVLKFPGYGTENGEDGTKILKEGSGRNAAGMDNGKSVSQSTYKPNGKNTLKGRHLRKPLSAQLET